MVDDRHHHHHHRVYIYIVSVYIYSIIHMFLHQEQRIFICITYHTYLNIYIYKGIVYTYIIYLHVYICVHMMLQAYLSTYL